NRRPYDLLLEAQDNRLLYIEVKATSVVNKDWFFISQNEYRFAVEKGNDFIIAQVGLSKGDLLRITTFRDTTKLMKSELKLALHPTRISERGYPKQVTLR
ncbi:histidine kinase-, DNA gyrase B-, and HSP90-like ATPase family protein, partial [Tanacetum coccineum]